MIANCPSVSDADRVNAMLQQSEKKQQLRYTHRKYRRKRKGKKKKKISKMISKQIRFITPMQISVDDSILGCDTQHSHANLGFFIHLLVWGNKRRMTKTDPGKTGACVYPAE